MSEVDYIALIQFAETIKEVDGKLIEAGMFGDREEIDAYRQGFQERVNTENNLQVKMAHIYVILEELLDILDDLSKITRQHLFGILEGRLIFAN